MTTPREVPDDLWTELDRHVIPAAPSHAKGGRKRVDARTLLTGML
jgi:hypothetical protein